MREDEWRRLGAENQVLRQRVASLQALRDVARSLSLELNLRPLLDLIMACACDLLRAEASSLLLIDRQTGELVFDLVRGGGGSLLQQLRMPATSGIPGVVIASRQAVIVNDADRDPRVRRDIADSVSFSVRRIAAAPIVARGRTIGVLEVLNTRSGDGFSEEDSDLLSALATQAAVAIENARLYAELREERDRLVDSEEMVRKNLQRELHDGLVQSLAAMTMKASVVAKMVSRDPARAQEEVAALEAELRQATHSARDLLSGLRPLVLETQGLTAALQMFVARVQQEGGPQIRLDLARFSGRLDHRGEVNVFGVVQEAVNNILKHAEAGHIWIKLTGKPEEYRVSIRDDGHGFDPKQTQVDYAQRASFGLLNMQERASYLGGRLRVTSHPGRGTSVVLTVAPGS